MKRLILSAVTALTLAIAPSIATAHPHARHGHVHYHRAHVRHHAYTHRYVAGARSETDQPFGFFQPMIEVPERVVGGVVGDVVSTVGRVVGGRPSGCPHAYCGCGTSLYFFHRIRDGLNLAANWLRFPHVAPQAGVAAVAPSRHHVLAVVSHVRGMLFQVHDSNSGHGLTRDHVRNLAGYTFVDPRA